MTDFTDFFDETKVINLDKDEDMMRSFEKEARKAGIDDVQRFSAIEYEIGHEGCKLSHLSIIEQAYENKNSVLVFEDDCEFIPNFQKEFEKAVLELQKRDWALFYLGIGFGPEMKYVPKPVGDHLFKLRHGWFTHALAYNTAYPGLVDHFRKTKHEVVEKHEAYDHYLSNEFFGRFPCFCARDVLALQKPRISNTVGDGRNFVPPLLRHFEQQKARALR